MASIDRVTGLTAHAIQRFVARSEEAALYVHIPAIAQRHEYQNHGERTITNKTRLLVEQ